MVEIARAFTVTDARAAGHPGRADLLARRHRGRAAPGLRAPLRRRGRVSCILISHLPGRGAAARRPRRGDARRQGGRRRRRRATSRASSWSAAMGVVDRGGGGRGAPDAGGRRRDRPVRVRAVPAAGRGIEPAWPTPARSSASPGSPATARRDLLLRALRAPRTVGRPRARSRGPVALVAGDRQADGIFPLWSIADNITIGSLARLRQARLLIGPRSEAARRGRLAAADRHPHARPGPTTSCPVRRQPAEGAVRARARLRRADRPDGRPDARRRRRHQARGLRPDPRGSAAEGRTFLWYTTEIDELTNCDRVYVFPAAASSPTDPARRADRGAGHALLVPGGRGGCALTFRA